jgi:hypothetical protein
LEIFRSDRETMERSDINSRRRDEPSVDVLALAKALVRETTERGDVNAWW